MMKSSENFSAVSARAGAVDIRPANRPIVIDRSITSLARIPMELTQPLFTSPQPNSDISDFGHFKVPNSGKPEFGWGEVGMGASCAPIPGEGASDPFRRLVPLTRIAQARSDLSPAGRSDASCESAND